MERFKLSELQAQAILDMQLRRLATLERQKILDELRGRQEDHRLPGRPAGQPAKILGLVKKSRPT